MTLSILSGKHKELPVIVIAAKVLSALAAHGLQNHNTVVLNSSLQTVQTSPITMDLSLRDILQ